MKEIYINADDYNSDSIKTIQGNNNAEEYKIYLQYDNEKIDLTGKTVNLGFLRVGSTEGDIIENLNVTNAKEGEITLKITNKLTKKNGTYSCQLAILGEGDFLEHTATFTLTVENNIFSDITKAIADSKDFTYLERILEEASKLSEKLKENTASATNANSNLESNIIEANNINSKLLENNEKATSLNKNLESNIDLAKEVKETIKDIDTKNIEATEKIQTLTGLNSKATELSNNIQQGLPLNSELIKNTESAKTANNELIATNNDAKAKKTDLDNSLEEAKKYISGLDGSKNPVQMQLDINELKNGLKSNQSLSYEGSSIAANNTLEGRTEGMRIVGRTLNNLIVDGHTKKEIGVSTTSKAQYSYIFRLKENTKYTVIWEIEDKNDDMPYFIEISNFENKGQIKSTSKNKGIGIINTTTGSLSKLTCYYISSQVGGGRIKNVMVLEGDWTNKEIPSFFEGLKSFGEAEGNKISILSSGKNLFNKNISVGIRIGNDGITENSNTNCASCLDYIEVEKGKTYEFVVNSKLPYYRLVMNYDENKKFINYSALGELASEKFIANGKFVRLVAENLRGSSNTEPGEINFMLCEFQKSISNYEPYKCDKKDILIKEPLRENDVLYEDNGQVKVYRDVKQYTFTGDESWIKSGLSDNSYSIFYINGYKPKGKIICNNFSYIDLERDKKEGICIIGDGSLRICINNNKLSSNTVEGFKTWLKANPTTIVYQLATPTIEVVENCVDIDLDTFGEKTYFSIENSLPGTLDFKVPSNIASIVQANSKAINELYNLIDTLVLPNILQNTTDIEMLKLEKLK